MDGVFGSGDPVEESRDDAMDELDDGNMADAFLGIPAGTPEGPKSNDGQPTEGQSQQGPDQGPPSGDDGNQGGPSDNGQPSQTTGNEFDWTLGKFKSPEDLARSYQELERKLHEKGQLDQLAAQMQYGQYGQQGPAMGQPYAQQPYPGYPAYNPYQPQVQPQAAQPVAQTPQVEDVDDNTWAEQFYENPRKALQQEAERLALKIIEERESQFGQQLGPILNGMATQVQALQDEIQWRDRITTEVDQLRNSDSDFDQVAPHLKAVLTERPDLKQGIRMGAIRFADVYGLAKQRAGTHGGGGQQQSSNTETNQAPQEPPASNKVAARMPQSSGARIPNQQPENDQLVDAFLGPSTSGGVFG